MDGEGCIPKEKARQLALTGQHPKETLEKRGLPKAAPQLL
jgi:hypothetical protein